MLSLRKKIIEILKTIYDPEIPVNIWDLGLIYGVDIDAKNNITIIMTFTSPNCPAIELLPRQIQEEIENNFLEIQNLDIKIVWDPKWSKNLMSEESKLELGIW
jgi:FeS assembly SUF system protein